AEEETEFRAEPRCPARIEADGLHQLLRGFAIGMVGEVCASTLLTRLCLQQAIGLCYGKLGGEDLDVRFHEPPRYGLAKQRLDAARVDFRDAAWRGTDNEQPASEG